MSKTGIYIIKGHDEVAPTAEATRPPPHCCRPTYLSQNGVTNYGRVWWKDVLNR